MFVSRLLLASASALLLATAAQAQAPGQAPGNPAANLNLAGDKQIAKTTRLSALTIAPGARISAPKGKSLTLTVDGVGVPVAPGDYNGDVVLTVTDTIPVNYLQLPTHPFRAALYVDDGKVVASKSVRAAIQGGSITDQAASNIRIVSNEEAFNGVLVTGASTYTLNDPQLIFTGNGGNDFAGFGAGIMSSGKADVTVNRARIYNRGAARGAIFVGGDSVMRINDSEIETYNGVLPADYKFTIDMGRMMEVPWMLGLSGNVRSSNIVDNGTLYLTNSRVRSQGWGALSTDDTLTVRMYVKNSLIETIDSGYGGYSIGDALNHFSGSILNVADIGMILAGSGSGTFTDGTVVNSKRFGVMMHSGGGAGWLRIEKGSVLNTASTAIQVKGRAANIIVDRAQLNTGNGVLLQAMPNDDPFIKRMSAGAVIGVQGSGATGADTIAAPQPPTPRPMPKDATTGPDVDATFRNVALEGDMYNGRTAEGGMRLKFEAASVVGALSTSTVDTVGGKEPTAETYRLIGEVTNTLTPTKEKFGLEVDLDAGSRWTVTRTSYLTRLTLAPGARLDAKAGQTVALKVDGKVTPVRPGVFQGKIELTVAPQ